MPGLLNRRIEFFSLLAFFVTYFLMMALLFYQYGAMILFIGAFSLGLGSLYFCLPILSILMYFCRKKTLIAIGYLCGLSSLYYLSTTLNDGPNASSSIDGSTIPLWFFYAFSTSIFLFLLSSTFFFTIRMLKKN